MAGTLVATAEGLKPIEAVEAGERVLAQDKATGELALRSVVRTFVKTTEVLVELVAGGERIVTTPEHPFWVVGQGWIGAGHLRLHDQLLTAEGTVVEVSDILERQEETTVYNMEVAEFHTYQVGRSRLLVHNSCEGLSIAFRAPSANAAFLQSPVAARNVADGSVRFKRWARGDAIDKPLPSGSAPSWETVQSRYWKNRHLSSKNTGEFIKPQMDEMYIDNAPLDFNPRTMQWERRELHHVDPLRHVINNNPINLRELIPDWHAEVDPMRKVPGIRPIRGIR